MINVEIGAYSKFDCVLGPSELLVVTPGPSTLFTCGLVMTASGAYRLTDEDGLRLTDDGQLREIDNG